MRAANAEGRGWAMVSGKPQKYLLSGQDWVSLARQVGGDLWQATPSGRAALPPLPIDVPDWPMDLEPFPEDLVVEPLPTGTRTPSTATPTRRVTTSEGRTRSPRGPRPQRPPPGTALSPAAVFLLPAARTPSGARASSRTASHASGAGRTPFPHRFRSGGNAPCSKQTAGASWLRGQEASGNYLRVDRDPGAHKGSPEAQVGLARWLCLQASHCDGHAP